MKIRYLPQIRSMIITPIQKYPVEFLFIVILLYLPEVSYLIFGDETNKIKHIVALSIFRLKDNVCIDVFFAYTIVCVSFLIGLWNLRCAKVFLYAFITVLGIISLSDILVFAFFGTHINTFTIQLLCQTNQSEALEFILTYSLTRSFFCWLIGILGLLLLFASGIRYFSKHRIKIWSPVVNILFAYLSYCVVFFASVLPAFSLNLNSNTSFVEKGSLLGQNLNSMQENFEWNLFQSVLQYQNQKREFDRCAAAQLLTNDVEAGPGAPKNLVFIIGESFNKYHSSLYGYPLQTNPHLSCDTNIVKFDDVVSCSNGTHMVFRYMMSVTNIGDSLEWFDAPLFPSIAKAAGYNVIFWSNQFPYSASMSQWDASCGFFHHPGVSPYFYDHTNISKFKYDGELIDDYKKKRNKLECDSNNLIIFHLMGQHVATTQRFPHNRTFFTQEMYKYRKELSEIERQQVADYDNATIYNDSVVAEIIKMYSQLDAVVIYSPDHGDEANDYQPHIGRTYHLTSAPAAHCQLDIPFLIYVSPECQRLHPELYARIKIARKRPFITDNMPHVIFDILNIKSNWYDSTKSVINEKYDTTRKREVYSLGDYDKAIKGQEKWKIGY